MLPDQVFSHHPLLPADIQTMFWEERQAQMALEGGGRQAEGEGGVMQHMEVHMPLIEQLKVKLTFRLCYAYALLLP